MKKTRYSINLVGCFFCFLLLSFFSFQSNAYPAPSSYFDTVQKTYIGYYQRAADPAGLIYWAGRLDSSGGNLAEIIEAFANSAESQALYGTINSTSIGNVLEEIYQSLLGRPADAGGKDYYVAGFNAGRFTAATIMLNLIDGIGPTGVDRTTFDNKLAAANLFTRTIDPELDGLNFQVTYAGNGDVIAARTFIAFVTSNSTTVPTQSQTTEYIQANIADPGDVIGGGSTSPSVFSGFDISLSEGTYWEYCWTYEHTSFTQSSSGTTTDAGNFRLTLGKPIIIGGVSAYPVSITGDSLDVDNHDYAPRWKYIAVKNDRIWGSLNGTTLEIIFDAKTGQWQGGGFFTTFSPSANIGAANSSINNEFINTAAVRTGWAAGQTQCQTIAGYTVCPNDTSYNLTESEYYKGGIGPIGYNFSLSWTSSGGGVYTSFSYKRIIGLVATSLKAVDGFVPKLPPWTKKADWPTPRIYHSSAVYNGKIYVFGGSTYNNLFTPSSAVDVYDPATNTWTSLSPMPIARSYHTSTEVNGKIYVIGGTTATTHLSSVDIYDPVANTWTRGSAMPAAQIGHSSTAAGGYIWVFLDNSQTVYAYSLARNNWSTGTSMPNSYYRRAASDVSINDKIYVMGGLDTYAASFKTTCMVFDLSQPYASSLAWTYKKSMSTGRRSLTSPVVNGKVYAIGGFNYNGYQRVVEVYDPATDTWTAKRSMMTAKESPVSEVVNGKIYVIGGRNDASVTLSSVEEYDPAND